MADLTLSQMALAWVLRRPEISCSLIGATRPAQIEENVKAADITLSDAALQQIEEALSPGEVSDPVHST